jgi:hypothetical protein
LSANGFDITGVEVESIMEGISNFPKAVR